MHDRHTQLIALIDLTGHHAQRLGVMYSDAGDINILCLFGSQSHSKLNLILHMSVCDCIDYKFYLGAHSARGVALFDNHVCLKPTNLRGIRVRK